MANTRSRRTSRSYWRSTDDGVRDVFEQRWSGPQAGQRSASFAKAKLMSNSSRGAVDATTDGNTEGIVMRMNQALKI